MENVDTSLLRDLWLADVLYSVGGLSGAHAPPIVANMVQVSGTLSWCKVLLVVHEAQKCKTRMIKQTAIQQWQVGHGVQTHELVMQASKAGRRARDQVLTSSDKAGSQRGKQANKQRRQLAGESPHAFFLGCTAQHPLDAASGRRDRVLSKATTHAVHVPISQ